MRQLDGLVEQRVASFRSADLLGLLLGLHGQLVAKAAGLVERLAQEAAGLDQEVSAAIAGSSTLRARMLPGSGRSGWGFRLSQTGRGSLCTRKAHEGVGV